MLNVMTIITLTDRTVQQDVRLGGMVSWRTQKLPSSRHIC